MDLSDNPAGYLPGEARLAQLAVFRAGPRETVFLADVVRKPGLLNNANISKCFVCGGNNDGQRDP
jgi:hypothetical protein